MPGIARLRLAIVAAIRSASLCAATMAAYSGVTGGYCAAPVADIEAHITGTVWKVEVAVGDAVSEGDTVVILESMKMEMPVESEDDGTVAEIRCEEGQSVQEGDVLVVLE
jgi:acetyl-CoA carboxylase biotin carboxyl carrier protein